LENPVLPLINVKARLPVSIKFSKKFQEGIILLYKGINLENRVDCFQWFSSANSGGEKLTVSLFKQP